MTNPEEGRKWFYDKHLFLRNTLHHGTSTGLCYKNQQLKQLILNYSSFFQHSCFNHTDMCP